MYNTHVSVYMLLYKIFFYNKVIICMCTCKKKKAFTVGEKKNMYYLIMYTIYMYIVYSCFGFFLSA